MSEETKVEAVTEATEADNSTTKEAAPKKKGKKWPIVVGVVAVVLIAAGAGFWVWHEQPSFCNAICHVPMDEYNATYDQEPNTKGFDKWGNEVANTSSMLAVAHKVPTEHGGAGATCMSCHVPTLGEQMAEGVAWVSGGYTYPLEERGTADLTKARGIEADMFCLNESCHNLTREDLVKATSKMERNPHVAAHSEVACSDCHKAHRASVLSCTGCHTETKAPEGWLTVAEEKKLQKPKS